MHVKKEEIQGPRKIKHSTAIADPAEKRKRPKLPNRARLKIITGRPYFYSVDYVFDKETKECKQKQKYLGTTLPPGFRLK